MRPVQIISGEGTVVAIIPPESSSAGSPAFTARGGRGLLHLYRPRGRHSPKRPIEGVPALPPDPSRLVWRRKEVLAELFQGIINSVTGIAGRGKGLPKMKQDCDLGNLPKLRVLTGDVQGTVKNLKFERIKTNLRGTVLRWQSSDDGDHGHD